MTRREYRHRNRTQPYTHATLATYLSTSLMAAIARLTTPVKGHVTVLDHVPVREMSDIARAGERERDALYLPAHGEDEEHAKVEDQDWPVDRNVKHLAHSEEYADNRCARHAQPK